VYRAQGRYDEAEQLLKEIVRTSARFEEEEGTYVIMLELADTYREQGRYVEAEILLGKTVESQRLWRGSKSWWTLETKNDMGVIYKKQDDYNKAELLLVEALEGRRLKLGDTHPHTFESWQNLIDLYESWNKPEQAAEWRTKLAQIEDFEE
jgi:tetratricopeptide (TPR) repeat protein